MKTNNWKSDKIVYTGYSSTDKKSDVEQSAIQQAASFDKKLTTRQDVAKFLKLFDKINLSPLRFDSDHVYNCRKSLFSEYEVLNVHASIIWVLENTLWNNSVNVVNKKIETPAGRYRSIIDIWRHIRFLDRRVSIFNTMSSMYDLIVSCTSGRIAVAYPSQCLHSTNIVGHFCKDVNRFVFTLKKYRQDFDLYNSRTEFGFKLDSYKNIT